jgi:IS30 family transposase
MSYTSNIIEVKGSSGIIKDMSKWQNNKKNIVSEFESDVKENMPSNYGNKWTDEERKRLVKLLKNSYDIDIIANKLNRSEGGIKAEIKKIVYAKYTEGNDAEAISKELNIVYNNVKSMIKVSIDKECENDINNLEKENKLLRLKIENIRLHKKLASINKKS